MKVLSRVVMAAAAVALALSATAAFAAPSPSPKVPAAPRNLKAVAGDLQVTLTWSTPNTGAPVYYNVITTPSDFPRTNTPDTTLIATGLHNGTAYTFAVRAWNGSAFGPASRVTATPQPVPPGPPNNLAATPGPGSDQYTLSWTPPTSSGSSNLDHYTATVSPGGVSQRLDSSTTTTVTSGLASNITYTFSVTASNTEGATGKAATVFAPLPAGATIGLQPTAGVLSTSITATGQNFLVNESITLYWDDPSHVASSVVTDDTGAFSKVVTPFATDKPKIHKLCASVPPKPCANFTLQAPPSPSPTPPSPSPGESPSPSAAPSGNPQASGARAGSGGHGLGFILKPPFVFLPIIAIAGLLGVLVYWALSRRRPVAPTSATVVHRATRPDYMAPFPSPARPPQVPPAAAPPPQVPPAVVPPLQVPPAVAPPTPALQRPPAPPAPPAQPLPPAAQPAQPPVEWPQAPGAPAPPAPPAAPSSTPPPTWPAVPDEPPDLPEPSD